MNSIKYAKSIPLEAKSDFGKGCHTRSTEPYFYEAAYLYVRDSPIPVNEEGECVVARAHPESDSASHPESSLVPRPFTKIRARVNACAREGEKGLVNNYASPRAKAGMLEQVLVCKH